jgi:hypothetical protein
MRFNLKSSNKTDLIDKSREKKPKKTIPQSEINLDSQRKQVAPKK